jgi:hypothetical protein
MISCNLYGGLGNQLFQVYTTIAYAIQTNKKFFFSNVEELKSSVTDRHTYWESFLKSLKPFLIDPKLINKDKILLIREKGFTYDILPLPISVKKINILNGYFQSYKYFDHYFQTINRLLKIDDIKVELTNKYRNLINDELPTSMHFRLGDYKKLPDHYLILSVHYYRAALNCLLETNKLTEQSRCETLAKVLYFCEEQDLEDVKTTIAILEVEFPNIEFIRADPELEDWQQLILMSLCRNNIIANSTFSWWGAYLNTYRQKKVVYPATWFGSKLQKTHNTRDLFPADWIKI